MQQLNDGRSNGCAYADSPGHIPIQRMANVSLQPDPQGPDTAGLIAQVERGLYIVGDKSWSIDMQRFNFQFTGQRFYAIEDGELKGQVRDVAYQATTTDFWGSMSAVGGPQTYVLGGAFNCGKAQPGQVAAVSHGCPSALFRDIRVLNVAEESAAAARSAAARTRSSDDHRTPQALVEHALAASTSEHCVVLVQDTTSANLRWANNTLTTNGVMHGVGVTVIAFHGPGNASVSGTATSSRRSAHSSSRPTPGPGRRTLPRTAPNWSRGPVPPTGTSRRRHLDRCLPHFAAALGEEFARAERESRILYGFVNHEVTTTYLGSSSGLRQRHVQPTGHYGCTGKTADLTTSAWVGGATRDFADVDAHRVAADLATRLSWGARRIDLPAGRYDTVLPPSAVADLMIDAYWSAGARVAHEGQSVYSRPGGGTRIGEAIVNPTVTLSSDPAYPGLECAPFVVASGSSNESSVYDNGLPLSPTPWIKKGTLTSLIQTRHTAQMTGQPTTPGIDNLVLDVEGGSGSDLDLVSGVEDGLLLTCLWYIREVDPQTLLLTGLTRDGVYRVEDGEVTGAVNNFRFNESPVDLLRRFTAAGATVPSFSREWGDDYFSRTATPALRVPDFNMSSVSQAL